MSMASLGHSPEFLHECFEYEEGNLIWKIRPKHHFASEKMWKIINSRYAGKTAGASKRYVMVGINGRQVGLHRVVYAMFHGDEVGIIDHIDGNTFNNRIENLRRTDHCGNVRNSRLRSDSSTGFKGVTRVGKRFMAQIKTSSGKFNLGKFGSVLEAHEAYQRAAVEHFGEYVRGDYGQTTKPYLADYGDDAFGEFHVFGSFEDAQRGHIHSSSNHAGASVEQGNYAWKISQEKVPASHRIHVDRIGKKLGSVVDRISIEGLDFMCKSDLILYVLRYADLTTKEVAKITGIKYASASSILDQKKKKGKVTLQKFQNWPDGHHGSMWSLVSI